MHSLSTSESVTYSIDVISADNGSDPVTDFAVIDALPAGISFVATLAAPGFDSVAVEGQQIEAQISSLAPGGTASLSFRALVE